VRHCAGTGANHAVAYFIDDGSLGGSVRLEVCWRARDPVLPAQAGHAVSHLRIAAGPKHRGPNPD
jgi:hypothetical protein